VSSTDDLITWLRARLDDAEVAVIRAMELGHPFLSAMGDPFDDIKAKRELLDAILGYEATIDSEWGCVHSASQIAAGECPEIRPGDIPAIRVLAQPYAGQPGWREEWRVAGSA
jgi:hypothetical protein